MTVTFDHLKPALVNSCIGMSESCVQKEQREKETEDGTVERKQWKGSQSEGKEKRDTKLGQKTV